MPERVKRVTMYSPSEFGGSEAALKRLSDRDLIKIGDDSLISVFPAAAQEPLDDQERAIIYRLLRYTVPDPDKPLITKRPGLVGGRAAVAGTRTAVWHVVDARQQGASDYDLRKQFGLSDEALRQAFAYYEAHKEEIDGDIFDNDRVSHMPSVSV